MTRSSFVQLIGFAFFLPLVMAGASGFAWAGDNSLLHKLECGVIEKVPPIVPFSPKGDDVKILIIGSSSTSGVGAGTVNNAYPHRTAFHLKMEEGFPNVVIVARGVGGERAKGALDRLSQALIDVSPDILVWQVGTNDALAKVPLSELEKSLQTGRNLAKRAEIPLILVDPQFFPRILENQHYSQTISFIEAFAKQHALPLVARYKRMKRALTLGDQAMTSLLAKDRFHMSALGHECLALDLASTLSAQLDSFMHTGELYQ